jgi:hypothetical protein
MGRILSALSPSPSKRQNFHNLPPRPHSPTKSSNTHTSATANRPRPPSSTHFAPALPKAPLFPTAGNARLPRRDEGMLSLNGSPLANPYQIGLGWFSGLASGDDDANDLGREDVPPQVNGTKAAMERPKLKKSKSQINIRRDPSLVSSHHSRSRTMSQTSAASALHSRTKSSNRTAALSTAHAQNHSTADLLLPSSQGPQLAALISLPTSDGHLLEFDPIRTSPGQLDALDGITDSAKRGAREEMGRLMKMVTEQWKIN